MQFPAQHFVWWTIFPPLYVFIKKHVFFFSWYCPGSLIMSLSTWFNTLYWFSDNHNTVYFCSEIALYSWIDYVNCKYKSVSILETLTSYPGCCTCWISHKWMIDSPTLWQLDSDWSVRACAHARGYPWNDWQLNNTAVSTNPLIVT